MTEKEGSMGSSRIRMVGGREGMNKEGATRLGHGRFKGDAAQKRVGIIVLSS